MAAGRSPSGRRRSKAGTDIQALSAMRPQGGVFGRISQKYALKEALIWRDGPFTDYRNRGNALPRKEYPDIQPQGRAGQPAQARGT